MPTFGIEEEVFIVEPTKPSLSSLYYLSKLVWAQPKKYLFHTDSNFARSKDIWQGLMSGVEISTFPHSDIESLIDDLKQRREELIKAADGLIVPLGHLLDFATPTNTCALQFHIGNLSDPRRVYENLVFFLPLLILLATNSPAESSRYFGQSYRLLNSYAVGPLRGDWSYRFQDIIFAKRTKTIEIRAFDPVWDIRRIELLARAIEAIAKLEKRFKIDLSDYNRMRQDVCRHGFVSALEERYKLLTDFFPINKGLFKVTPSDIIYKHYQKYGLEPTYTALDSGYRQGKLIVKEQSRVGKNKALKSVAGLATYYIPKLPYDLWKYLQEK